MAQAQFNLGMRFTKWAAALIVTTLLTGGFGGLAALAWWAGNITAQTKKLNNRMDRGLNPTPATKP